MGDAGDDQAVALAQTRPSAGGDEPAAHLVRLPDGTVGFIRNAFQVEMNEMFAEIMGGTVRARGGAKQMKVTVEEQQRRSERARLEAYYRRKRRKKQEPFAGKNENASFKNMRLFDRSKLLCQSGGVVAEASDRFRRLMRDHGGGSAVVLLPEDRSKSNPKPKPTSVSDWRLACRYCGSVITVQSPFNQMLEATIRCLHCKKTAAGRLWRR
jgi:hypothetical protein